MKKAFDSYLQGGGANPADKGGAPAPGPEDFASMFGEEQEDPSLEKDPLMEALEAIGYDVPPEKLDQIRAILESKSEGETKPPGGDVGASQGPGGGGGAVPAAMSTKAGQKF